MNARPIYMTRDGLKQAGSRLDRLCTEFEEICRERTVAHEFSGDGWHDNPHFNRLQQLEADKSREIAVLKALLGSVRVVEIDPERRPVDAVRIGSLVRVLTGPLGKTPEASMIWEIVGYEETDTARSRLAYNSPLGAALIGKEEGDVLAVSLAGNQTEVTIDALLLGERQAF